jgi:hypothetical protein
MLELQPAGGFSAHTVFLDPLAVSPWATDSRAYARTLLDFAVANGLDNATDEPTLPRRHLQLIQDLLAAGAHPDGGLAWTLDTSEGRRWLASVHPLYKPSASSSPDDDELAGAKPSLMAWSVLESLMIVAAGASPVDTWLTVRLAQGLKAAGATVRSADQPDVAYELLDCALATRAFFLARMLVDQGASVLGGRVLLGGLAPLAFARKTSDEAGVPEPELIGQLLEAGREQGVGAETVAAS